MSVADSSPATDSGLDGQLDQLLTRLMVLYSVYSDCLPPSSFQWHWDRLVTATRPEELVPYQLILLHRSPCDQATTTTASHDEDQVSSVDEEDGAVADLHYMYTTLSYGESASPPPPPSPSSSSTGGTTVTQEPHLTPFAFRLFELAHPSTHIREDLDAASACVPRAAAHAGADGHRRGGGGRRTRNVAASGPEYEPLKPAPKQDVVDPTDLDAVNLVERAFVKGIWRITPSETFCGRHVHPDALVAAVVTTTPQCRPPKTKGAPAASAVPRRNGALMEAAAAALKTSNIATPETTTSSSSSTLENDGQEVLQQQPCPKENDVPSPRVKDDETKT